MQRAATAAAAALLVAAPVPAAGDGMTDGWFTSSRAEVLQEEPLIVHGSLPAWLKGEFVKHAASVYEEPKRNLTHVFDGYGKVLRWRFSGVGVPTLRARMLQSNWWEKSEAAGDIVPSALFDHTAPKYSAAQELDGLATNCSDNFNVNFHDFGAAGRIVALTDSTPSGAVISADDLSSARKVWRDAWADAMFDRMSPAHPRTIPDGTRDTVSVVERINPTAVAGLGKHDIIVYRVSYATGARTILHKIKTKHLPYFHSIGATSRYAILCAGPLRWEIPVLMHGGTATEAYRWGPETRSTVYLVPLDPTQDVTTYDTDPFFAFHHINAWEDGSGAVMFDVMRNVNVSTATPSPVATLTLDIQRDRALRDANGIATELRRYTLPQGGTKATWEAMDVVDAAGKRSMGDLPAINTALAGKKHCIVYIFVPGVSEKSWTDVGLVRKDTCDASAPATVWYRPNHYPGEAVFVAGPSGAEGDGVLLSATHDGDAGATYLLVLNATTMRTIAEVRRRETEQQHIMGFGVHGQFYPAE